MRNSSTKCLRQRLGLRVRRNRRRTRPCASTVAAMLLTMSMLRNRPGGLAVLRHHADAGALAVPRPARVDRAARRCGSCPPPAAARRRSPRRTRVRPEPISPARQTISPARTVIDADAHEAAARRRSPASSTTSPALRGPRRRAQMRRRARPSGGSARRRRSSATSRVPASWPSLSTVTEWQSAKISARRCET